MNNLRQNFQHPQWGSIVGNEKDIRLAALKDELKLWQQRVANDDGVHWYIRDMLKKRIEELERSTT